MGSVNNSTKVVDTSISQGEESGSGGKNSGEKTCQVRAPPLAMPSQVKQPTTATAVKTLHGARHVKIVHQPSNHGSHPHYIQLKGVTSSGPGGVTTRSDVQGHKSGKIVSSFKMMRPSTRQPIRTTLISSQPKGATGQLCLTDEEKRTLISEGYPVPSRLPLTKPEERSLKKIRRKIKNKISAQESRRKKKEYMDCLEKRMNRLASDLEEYKVKCSNLESHNSSLLSH